MSNGMTPYDWVIGVSDLGLTGHPDLIVRERATGHLYAIRTTTKGLLTRRFLAAGMGQYDLAG